MKSAFSVAVFGCDHSERKEVKQSVALQSVDVRQCSDEVGGSSLADKPPNHLDKQQATDMSTNKLAKVRF